MGAYVAVDNLDDTARQEEELDGNVILPPRDLPAVGRFGVIQAPYCGHHLFHGMIAMSSLTFKPLEPSRWEDFTTLFGERGACGGCWCMLWRLPRSQFEAQKGDGNREAMQTLVNAGEIPGILAYQEGHPVGWCALAPRERYPALARSRILKPLDEQACWSIACLFIDRAHRQTGIATALIQAAVVFARSQGATLIEGYPVEPKSDRPIPAAFAWTGIPKLFLDAGFKEVARRSPTRPIMRRCISSDQKF